MDMYYFLKEKLNCDECGQPLKVVEAIGYMEYHAVCAICNKDFEVSLEVKNGHRK